MGIVTCLCFDFHTIWIGMLNCCEKCKLNEKVKVYNWPLKYISA